MRSDTKSGEGRAFLLLKYVVLGRKFLLFIIGGEVGGTSEASPSVERVFIIILAHIFHCFGSAWGQCVYTFFSLYYWLVWAGGRSCFAQLFVVRMWCVTLCLNVFPYVFFPFVGPPPYVFHPSFHLIPRI